MVKLLLSITTILIFIAACGNIERRYSKRQYYRDAFTECHINNDTAKMVPGTDSIPIYQGLERNKKEKIHTKGDECIIQSYYEGNNTDTYKVINYYNQQLQIKGWKKVRYSLYERDNKQLSLNAIKKRSKVMMTFTIRFLPND